MHTGFAHHSPPCLEVEASFFRVRVLRPSIWPLLPQNDPSAIIDANSWCVTQRTIPQGRSIPAQLTLYSPSPFLPERKLDLILSIDPASIIFIPHPKFPVGVVAASVRPFIQRAISIDATVDTAAKWLPPLAVPTQDGARLRRTPARPMERAARFRESDRRKGECKRLHGWTTAAAGGCLADCEAWCELRERGSLVSRRECFIGSSFVQVECNCRRWQQKLGVHSASHSSNSQCFPKCSHSLFERLSIFLLLSE